jgi:UDP-2,3-diacylglucosamine pyrophosphatase LpxH
MKTEEFRRYLADILETAECIQIKENSRIVIISDLHLGDGSARDDSMPNIGLLVSALRDYYLPKGFLLVLNGDVEELQKNSAAKVRRAHGDLYGIFDSFDRKNHFRKIVGNHDQDLLTDPAGPYKLSEALRLDHPAGTLLCFHGHQPSEYYVRFGAVSEFLVRYLGRPLGIKNRDRPMTSKRRRKVERQSYLASRKLGIASVIGHTHRPLFESLSKYDQLRFRLESLISSYASGVGPADEAQEEEIRVLAHEVRSMVRKRDRKGAGSLYDTDGVPVPCLFNSGCATGKSGVTCIEISGDRISMVLWSKPGRVKAWIEREALERSSEGGEDCPSMRYTLRSDTIDAVFTRIRLLSEGVEANLPLENGD